MDKQAKKDVLFLALISVAGIVAILCSALYSNADTGLEAATRTEMGSYHDFRRVNIGSTTANEIFPADTKRPDGVCRAIGPTCSVIWVGTTSAHIHGATHSNITLGFPIYVATETIKLDGSNSGPLYATAGVECSTQTVSCWDGKVR